jgi:hypothetical protein
MPDESEIEIRQTFESENLGVAFTADLRVQEERLRANFQAKGRAPLVCKRFEIMLKALFGAHAACRAYVENASDRAIFGFVKRPELCHPFGHSPIAAPAGLSN